LKTANHPKQNICSFKMKLVYLIFGTLCFQLCNVELEAKSIEGPVPFHRYWRKDGSDHYYTTEPNQLGGVKVDLTLFGYQSEGIACRIFPYQTKDLSPLYMYYNDETVDHFYTLNEEEIGTTTPGEFGNHGYQSAGIAGYCSKEEFPGSIPLYRYWNHGDHFYTTNVNEIGTTTPGHIGKHGYYSEGIACYVLPA
jgi:hypothetical protein